MVPNRDPDHPADPAGVSDIPDFCSPGAVLAVVIIAELTAIVMSLAANGPGEGFLLALSTASMFILWLALISAAALCLSRNRLALIGRKRALLVAFVMLQLVNIVVSETGWWLNASLANFQLTSLSHGQFLTRNIAISAIVSAMALRYLYVTGEWRRNVELESHARIRALQARIRPHFFFNSMNTIAELTRSNPPRAEAAIEDLADLFRATLGESQHRIPLREELEVARIYQRMERLRLGERLVVDWQIDDTTLQALIPGLSVQPLLENAIYHGIERLPEGGTIRVCCQPAGANIVRLSIENPVVPGDDHSAERRGRKGNQLALDNIRQRFDLAYAGKASVEVTRSDECYRVELRFPLTEHPA